MDFDLGIYLHIPFCLRKCSYCDFLSFVTSPDTVTAYLEALKHEIALASGAWPAPLPPVTSVYLGGGTPSLLSNRQLQELLDCLRRYFPVGPGAEVTVEANPGTVDAGWLAGARAAGVNRLSLGVQSFNDRLLGTMGRLHTASEARAALTMARKCGFENINIDLIYGLPGQNVADWQQTLATAVELAPEHISCYGLEIHPDTPWGLLAARGEISLPDENLWEEMFWLTDSFLTASGFQHYEIANYCRPGRESRHNLRYWQRRNYLGLGLGAASMVGCRRWQNHTELRPYLDALEAGELPVAQVEEMTIPEILSEFFILGLRLLSGVNLEQAAREFPEADWPQVYRAITRLETLGLVERCGPLLRLSRRAWPVANEVFAEFIG